MRGGKKLGFEIKYSESPEVTPSMRHAISDLGLERLDVIHSGGETFEMSGRFRAVSMDLLWRDIPPPGRRV